MPMEPDVVAEILAAFNERSTRGGTQMLGACPLCHSLNDWTIGDGFVTMLVTDAPMKVEFAGEAYPLVGLVCRNCGNTQLINLYVLGLHDLIKRLNPNAPGQIAAQEPSGTPSDG